MSWARWASDIREQDNVALRSCRPPPPFADSFRTDLRARAAYSEGAGVYRILPAAVALPADEADLVELLKWAVGSRQSADSRQPLVPRGAGSAMGGGNVGEGVWWT